MTVVVNIVLAMALIPLALVDLVFLLETGLGLRRSRDAVNPIMEKRIVVLIPAHNEAATLAASGAVLAELVQSNVQVVMIADNCSDDTAMLGRGLGLEVVERHDATRRGKGYALDFGRSVIAPMAPNVVIVLDADCEISSRDVARLADAALSADRPVQAAYVFRPAPSAPPVVQISNFAFMMKNVIRQRGIQRAGGSAVLTGSGMAFPWHTFEGLDLAGGNVVEDLAIGISLIEQGVRALFYEGATVLSDCSNRAGSQTQRARWEGGFIATARKHALTLLATGLLRSDWQRLWMGLHLLVPPLSILMSVNLVASIAFGGGATLGAGAAPFLITGGFVLAIGCVVATAWLSEGQMHLTRPAAWRLPQYIGWKLAIYARIVSGQQKVEWKRTDRVDP